MERISTKYIDKPEPARKGYELLINHNDEMFYLKFASDPTDSEIMAIISQIYTERQAQIDSEIARQDELQALIDMLGG